MLLVLAGCSADARVVGPDEPPTTADGSDAGREPERLASSAPDPLRLAMVRPSTVDPRQVVLTDQAGVIMADLLYDGLTEAVGTEGQLRPGLARSWSANDDFTIWTFELDPAGGIRGQEVAEALSAYARDGEPASGGAGAAATVAADIRSVSVRGDTTVLIRLKAPNAGLPWILSGLPFAIAGKNGESTGDYRVEREDEATTTLAARTVDLTGPEGIVVHWVDDGTRAYEMLRAGEVDAAVVDQQSFVDAEQRFATVAVATSAVRFYVLNANSPVLATPEARRAVLAAVDRSALVGSGFDQAVVETDGLLSPSLAGYDERVGCGQRCTTDPAVATEVLAAIGPTDLRVAYTGDDQEELARSFTKQLRSAGFGARHVALAPDDLASRIVGGDTDVFAFGWVAPATSSDAVVPPLLAIDSPANIARIDSPAVARLLAEAAVTAEDGPRWGLLADAHRAAMDDALLLPIAASTSMLVSDSEVDSLTVRADGSIDLESAG